MGRFVEAWRNGQVTRKHTMENLRAENDAEHTWGLVMLLMVAWPAVPMYIVKAAQVHDCGERAVGDMPGPVKWANPELGAMMEALEHAHITDSLPAHLCEELKLMSDSDWAVIEFFDRAEFCISMARERRLGNTYAMIYFDRSFNKMTATIDVHGLDFQAMDLTLWEGMVSLRRELMIEEQELKRL